MASKKYTELQVIEAISTSRSWKEAVEKIGLKYAGGNARTVKKIAIRNNINTSHFLGQGWNLGGKSRNEVSIEKSFVENSNMSKSGIRRKVLKYNLITYKCQKCGLADTWQNQPIVLHLDHINGNIKDNTLANLRFLCPNCHSQTSTYCRNGLVSERRKKTQCINCGKSIFDNKTGYCRSCWGKKVITLDDIGISKDDLQDKISRCNMESVCREIKVSVNVLRRICREKNIVIPNFKSASRECKNLAIMRSRKFHVNKDELEQLLKTKSILQIGKMFGVCDHSIRKRCKMMGIDWRSISKFVHNKNNTVFK